MDPEEIILEAQELMEKALAHTNHDFGGLHTGKASPSMVESLLIHVSAYNSSMALRELAAVTTPDSRTIQIQPWDKNSIKDIEKGIIAANIGLNPSIQGNLLRIPIPELSGERRKELVKVANKIAEDGRISIRHGRHHALEPLKKAQKAGDISEDDLKRLEKDVQELTDEYIGKINDALKAKEEDLLEV